MSIVFEGLTEARKALMSSLEREAAMSPPQVRGDLPTDALTGNVGALLVRAFSLGPFNTRPMENAAEAEERKARRSPLSEGGAVSWARAWQ